MAPRAWKKISSLKNSRYIGSFSLCEKECEFFDERLKFCLLFREFFLELREFFIQDFRRFQRLFREDYLRLYVLYGCLGRGDECFLGFDFFLESLYLYRIWVDFRSDLELTRDTRLSICESARGRYEDSEEECDISYHKKKENNIPKVYRYPVWKQ